LLKNGVFLAETWLVKEGNMKKNAKNSWLKDIRGTIQRVKVGRL
jgi:hypothetical protein